MNQDNVPAATNSGGIGIIPLIYIIGLCILTLEFFNPFGLGQRIFFDQRPPYHWKLDDTLKNSPGSLREQYLGSNGKDCATVYHYSLLMDDFKVYGFGFSEYEPTREAAEKLAERECR